MASELSERAQQLLKTLIETYIREGQPVGSRSLARDSELDLSPATVRSVMADLEELGLVISPHTSAGRIPTPLGYRVFVDSLLTVKPLDSNEVLLLKRQFDPDDTIPDLLKKASVLLSGVSRMAGLVTLPRRKHFALRHAEFVGLSENRVLAIFVVNDAEVQNRVIHTKRRFSPAELQQAANYLNTEYTGKDLEAVRAGLIHDMGEAKEAVVSLLRSAMEATEKVYDSEAKGADFVLAGETNLMDFAELSDVGKLRQLFGAFDSKRDILHLLDQCSASNGVQIFIGDESGYNVLGDCSIVTAPYEAEGRKVGMLAIIGPTRMAYERVIPVVDVTAKLLGAALNSRQ